MSKQPDEQLDTLDMSVTSRLKRVRMAYRKSQKENQRLREALEVYANHDNWDTEAVAHDMETGDFPDVNGNTPTVDIRIELGIPIVWNWSDEGYSLAEKELSDG